MISKITWEKLIEIKFELLPNETYISFGNKVRYSFYFLLQ